MDEYHVPVESHVKFNPSAHDAAVVNKYSKHAFATAWTLWHDGMNLIASDFPPLATRQLTAAIL
jgi:hypothetical protein